MWMNAEIAAKAVSSSKRKLVTQVSISLEKKAEVKRQEKLAQKRRAATVRQRRLRAEAGVMHAVATGAAKEKLKEKMRRKKTKAELLKQQERKEGRNGSPD